MLYLHRLEEKGGVYARAATAAQADDAFTRAFFELGHGQLAILTAQDGLPAGIHGLRRAYVTLDDGIWDAGEGDHGELARSAFAVVELVSDTPTIDPRDPAIRDLLGIAVAACGAPGLGAHYAGDDSWELAETTEATPA